MSKDPAFLFYYRDFDHGTRYMKLEAIGAYIKCLCEQADKGVTGVITPEHMFIICQSHDEIMLAVCSKFVKDKDGNYYNLRLREELVKRHEYAESRRNNRVSGAAKKKEKEAIMSLSYVPHMANANADANGSEIKESITGEKFELMGLDFPPKHDNSGNPLTLRSSKLEQRYMSVSREGKLKATFEQALVTMHKAIYTQDFEDQKHFENWFMVIAKDKPSITGKPKFVQ